MADSERPLALVSVFDKTGVIDFSQILIEGGYEIVSTGGTARTLEEAGIPVLPIERVTGNPELFGGRMKTISFAIESGILYDRFDPDHVRQAHEHGIRPVDVVVCNLYPFEDVTKDPDVSFYTAIENIDIGGPTMIRAGAKNHRSVLVVVDPNDYERVGEAIRTGLVTNDLREELAEKTFHHTAFYDALVAQYMRMRSGRMFPEELTIPYRRVRELRYGENPHQIEAYEYITPNKESAMATVVNVAKKEPSLTNILDINAGIEAVRLFDEPTVVVIKHGTAAGISQGETLVEAYAGALDGDRSAGFGGIVVGNRPIDSGFAEETERYKANNGGQLDIIAGTDIDDETLARIRKVRPNTEVFTFKLPSAPNPINQKTIDGGLVRQVADGDFERRFGDWEVVSESQPTANQMKQAQIGWKFISRMKSNTVIVMDRERPMTRGIGVGQTARNYATEIALQHAGDFAKGSILISDAFFPFEDCVEMAIKAGIAVIVETGSAQRDQKMIDLANEANIVLVFTHNRAFYH